MGGQPDKEGSIDAELLIKIIKQDFEMTIDIEKLIQDIDEDGSGQIEYDEFKNLLSSSDWFRLQFLPNKQASGGYFTLFPYLKYQEIV